MNTVTIVGRVGRDASEDFKSFDSGKLKQDFLLLLTDGIQN